MCLHPNDAILLADSKKDLQRVMSKSNCKYARKKVKVNLMKIKVTVCQRKEILYTGTLKKKVRKGILLIKEKRYEKKCHSIIKKKKIWE